MIENVKEGGKSYHILSNNDQLYFNSVFAFCECISFLFFFLCPIALKLSLRSAIDKPRSSATRL